MKKNWNVPAVEEMNIQDTADTYVSGINPDGSFTEDNCEKGDPTYSS